jgi:hypothetical protein
MLLSVLNISFELSPINAYFVCWAVTIAFWSLKMSASFSEVETAFEQDFPLIWLRVLNFLAEKTL